LLQILQSDREDFPEELWQLRDKHLGNVPARSSSSLLELQPAALVECDRIMPQEMSGTRGGRDYALVSSGRKMNQYNKLLSQVSSQSLLCESPGGEFIDMAPCTGCV